MAAPTTVPQESAHAVEATRLARVLAHECRVPERDAVLVLLEHLLGLQEEMRIGVSLIDRSDGRPLFGSARLLAIFGFTQDEFLRLPSASSLIDDAERARLEERRARGGDNALVPWYEVQARRGDGSRVDIEVSTTTIELGARRLAFNLVRDITDRKRTEREMRRARERLTNQEIELAEAQKLAHIGSWEWDPATGVVTWSAEMYRIFGLRAEEFDGRQSTARKYVHPEDLPTVERVSSQMLATGRPGPTDYRIIRPDGTVRFLHTEGALLEHDGRTIFRGATQDVTDLRFAEQSLQALTRELMRSNEELEQFAYVASHDLREPLRIISGYLGILDRRFGGALPEEARGFVTAAVAGAARMEQLISHLLEYSRVGRTQGEFLPVDANECLAEALANLRLAIDENKATVTSDTLPIVVAEGGQVVQLLQNLVGNALKFRRDDPPQIHVGARRHGREWQLFVRDNGIGIDEKDFQRVFELFQRLHPSQDYPGSGIGLAIARKIVERHGGRIWVESNVGVGSTFWFSFPMPE